MVACALLLHPAVSGAQCGRACSRLGLGCVPPLLGVVGVCVCSCARRAWSPALSGWGCRAGVRVCGRTPLVPRLSWPGCAVCAWVLGPGLSCAPPFLVRLSGCVLFFSVLLCGVGRWLSPSRALWSLLPHPLPFRVGCWPLFLFCVACVCAFWVSLFPVGRCSWLGVAGFGWVVPLCPFWGSRLRCLLGGGFCRLLWCWRAVWWLSAILLPPPPPSPPFSLGGGLPVPPSASPWLVHALARIQCGLPGCCWRSRFVWPSPGPMGRVGYVHVGLGVSSCRVRSWLCRLSGCARRLPVGLG